MAGWIGDPLLGPVYEREPFVFPNFNGMLSPGTAIARHPDGPSIHQLSARGIGYDVAVIGGRSGDWVEIEYVAKCRPTLRVRGYVRNKAILPTVTTRVFVCNSRAPRPPPQWGELANAAPVIIPVDTEMRAADGALIGRARGPGELRRGRDGVLHALTAWGLIPVVIP